VVVMARFWRRMGVVGLRGEDIFFGWVLVWDWWFGSSWS
jgi:hypothetical protein